MNDPLPTRPLSSFERLFWLYDQYEPFHFAMVARVTGIGRKVDWRGALDALQRRHPFLRVTIDAQRQAFVPSSTSIPLRTLTGQSGEIGKVVSRELSEPVVPDLVNPLVRAVTLEDGKQTDLVLVAHHAIADGLSLAFALRDWVKLASGYSLPEHAVPKSQETELGLTKNRIETSPHAQRAPKRRPPTVDCFELPWLHTAALKEACRAEGTTVHGALCAALELSGRTQGWWAARPVTLLSPVSTRRLGGCGEDVRLAIIVTAHTAPPRQLGFWETARSWHEATRDALQGAPDALAQVGGFIAGDPSPGDVACLMADAFTSNGMVSNLGELPIEVDHRDLTITAMHGPSILTGTPGEQVIGALSIGGRLFLTRTTDDPIPGLLQRMGEQLKAVISL